MQNGEGRGKKKGRNQDLLFEPSLTKRENQQRGGERGFGIVVEVVSIEESSSKRWERMGQ